MAYGTKYRLDFSDTEGNKRRLDILKKDYTGSINPLVGAGSPAIIKWEQDNDFYDPIIASNCEINLIQTDTVTYDEFYDFDEREFLVKIYYAETRQPYWEDINDQYQDYNELWNSADPEDNFILFWQGFLIQDTYQQKITAAPFNVSFKAVDGLGLLKGIDFPIAPNYDVTLWECLHKTLLETGFDANIFVKTDLKEENTGAVTNVFEDVKVNSSTYTDENTYKFDAAKVLNSILSGFNCRIFQSNGDWFIINNADITKNSSIVYRKYNSAGVYENNFSKGQILYIPNDALPVGNDFVKETSGGLIEVKTNIDLSRQKKLYS